MKIALYGIYGTYNFGCEAIVRGARQFILDTFPEATVKYLSYSYDYDKKALADLDIEIVPVVENKTFIKRIVNKGLRLIGENQRLFYFNINDLLSDVDLVFSIGGDIYTIPAVLREKKRYPYYNPLIDFCCQSHKPVVVYGASVGPWGKYDKAVNYYSYYMKMYKAILCREQSSVKYLKQLDFTNVMFFPDPAFQLGEGKHDNGEYVGINLSPLSLNEVYGNHGEAQLERMACLIDSIYEKIKRPILFLPHVLSSDEGDNDLWFMEKIKEKMSHKDNVTIADCSGGFLAIKNSIRKCHIVISARMHCAINAMEENVPTILLAYSQKSIGMCEYVYGDTHWCVELKDMEKLLIDRVIEMDLQHAVIVKRLIISNKKINQEYQDNLEQVKKKIC